MNVWLALSCDQAAGALSAMSEGVRSFGQMLERDHTDANQKAMYDETAARFEGYCCHNAAVAPQPIVALIGGTARNGGAPSALCDH